MIVAFDFDGTWTRDPVAWRNVVALFKARGHTCILVTGRSDEDAFGAEVKREIGRTMPVVFSGGGWKKEAAARAGYEVDIWVDDQPEGIARIKPVIAEGKDRFTAEWTTVEGRDPARTVCR